MKPTIGAQDEKRSAALRRTRRRNRTGVVVLVVLVACVTRSSAGGDVRLVVSFDEPDSAGNWVSVNDGVMGGVSKGSFERTGRNTLLFSGELS